MLSPVKADSSTELSPSSTNPSTGMLAPGLTTKISPILTRSIGTSFSSPFSKSIAVFGASFIMPFRASVVFPFDLASSIFPTVIKVTIIAADSK